jgi:hypothetical protein
MRLRAAGQATRGAGIVSDSNCSSAKDFVEGLLLHRSRYLLLSSTLGAHHCSSLHSARGFT